jgi:MFS family permease
MSFLVSTVLAATLVVGPFYLAGALALDATAIGLVLSVGPLAVALIGVPAGRSADRRGAEAMTLCGLVAIRVSSILLGLIPASLSLAGYIMSMVILTGAMGCSRRRTMPPS